MKKIKCITEISDGSLRIEFEEDDPFTLGGKKSTFEYGSIEKLADFIVSKKMTLLFTRWAETTNSLWASLIIERIKNA